MIVIDASVAVKWFVPEAGDAAAQKILADGHQLIAPCLIRLEVAGGILRHYRSKKITESEALAACDQWSAMLADGVIHLVASAELYDAALPLAFKCGLKIPDCLYLATGKAMKAPLITADKPMHERGLTAHRTNRVARCGRAMTEVLTRPIRLAEPTELIVAGKSPHILVPRIITDVGEHATRRFIEFFTANIRNRNTRGAYAHAVGRFLDWCEGQRRGLRDLEPFVIATYIEQLMTMRSAPTVKQHLAAIRMLMDWLVIGQVIPFNPGRLGARPTVCGEKRENAGPLAGTSPVTDRINRCQHAGRHAGSRPHRCDGLLLRPRERRGRDECRGLLAERQTLLAAVA